MSGLVGVIAQETGRFTVFAASLTELKGHHDVKWILGHDIADNTNQLVEEMRKREAEWLWILGDDHAFSPDALERLLAHLDRVDIVVPLCLQRNPPYRPVVYTGFMDGGPMREIINLEDHPAGGLVPIHSAGNAGMLITRRVFDGVAEPWFESGKIVAGNLGEDVYFCDKAREAGFQLYCDLDVPFGHCQTSTIWPVREPDGWTFAFQWGGGMEITLPPHRSWALGKQLAET